jgi:methylated-DNA-[protein]-cysteine S-methyltransferase
MEIIHFHVFKTSYGELNIGDLNGQYICLSDWSNTNRWNITQQRILKHRQVEFVYKETELVHLAKKQLKEYFERKRETFSLPLKFIGSSFQKEVWTELENIPYGCTITYAELSQRLGNEKVIRAAANANAANPLSIIIPCHRVIGKNNNLTGYAGGLNTKKQLLQMEGSWPLIDQLQLFDDEIAND